MQNRALQPRVVASRPRAAEQPRRTIESIPAVEGLIVQPGLNILALLKGAERYVFLYDDASRGELLRTLRRFADDPELSFNWHDHDVLVERLRSADTGPPEDGRSQRLPFNDAA